MLFRKSKTEGTRAVEDDFGLGDCLYFYAGHACPEFGDVVLVYEPDWTITRRGGATEFDTGGLHAGLVKANGAENAAARVQYFQAHDVGLSVWPAEFTGYVKRHFTSAGAYVRGERPTKDDDSGRLLHPDNERRAWTWEVRLLEDHPAFEDVINIYVTPDYFEDLRREILSLGDSDRRKWIDWLRVTFIKHSYAESGFGLHARVEADLAGTL